MQNLKTIRDHTHFLSLSLGVALFNTKNPKPPMDEEELIRFSTNVDLEKFLLITRRYVENLDLSYHDASVKANSVTSTNSFNV